MIISAASDYRAAAQRILPPFLFHYMDGGAYSEYTLRRNVEEGFKEMIRSISGCILEPQSTTLFLISGILI